MLAARFLPWTDANGRPSWLKAVTLLLCCLPALLMAYGLLTGTIGGKVITVLLRETGDWAIRFLVISLAVTPLRRITGSAKVMQVRRMLGLTALFYLLAHITLYGIDQKWVWTTIASEIVLRIYLTIGFVALLGMVVLGVTSNMWSIRLMGEGWHRLHRITYVLALLGLMHYFLQSRLDVSQPTVWSGLFLFAMGCRVLHQRGISLTALPLTGLSVATAALTLGLEYAWYALATGVPAWRVTLASFSTDMLRPAHIVLGVGLAVAIFAGVWQRWRPLRAAR